MKPKLKSKSKKQWLKAVLNDIDSFLQDHADNERKSSAFAMGFVAKYPQRVAVVPKLIEIALDELGQFRDLYALMKKRKVELTHELAEDLYIKNLIWQSRNGRQERFLDRMVIASVIEARNAERYAMIAPAMDDADVKKHYASLAKKSDKLSEVYLTLVGKYFEEAVVKERLSFFEAEESKILASLEVRAVLH